MSQINSVQYLRAIAAMSVVFFHASTSIGPYSNHTLERILQAGAAGVDVFFVISGFIMYTITSRNLESPDAFLKKRAIRIIPLYWAATLLLIALTFLHITPSIIIDAATVPQSLFFIPYFSPDHPHSVYPLLVPGWTLNYEMFFYLLFAFSLFFANWKNGTLAVITTILLTLFVVGRLAPSGNALMLTYTSPLLLEFLGGVLIGLVWDRRRRLSPYLAAATMLLSVMTMVLMARHTRYDPMYRLAFWGLPAVALVFCALHTGWLSARNRLFLLIGDASYAIYIIHMIAIAVLRDQWARAFGAPDQLADALGFMVVCALISCALGVAVHLLLEQPFDTYLRARLLPRRDPALASGVAAE